jgi:predicted P-loop ATPase
MNQLTTNDYAMFAKIGVPPEMVEQAGIVRVTDAEARTGYGFNGTGSNAGLLYPYRDPETGQFYTARLRRDNPPMKDGKPDAKYLAQAGRPKHLFLIPGTGPMLKDSSILAVAVESEKASVALTSWAERNGKPLLPFATGGCNGWLGQNPKNPKGRTVPLSDFNLFGWTGRAAVILFDSNSATNPAVQTAQARFAAMLSARGANVRIGTLPQGVAGLNGPDDAIAILGDAAITEALENAQPYSEDWRTKLLCSKDGSIKPLLSNAVLLLQHSPEWAGVLRFNEFSLTIETDQPAPFSDAGNEEWTDDHTARTTIWLQQNGCSLTSTKQTHEAICVVARRRSYHPIRAYLAALAWDGTPRIDDWLRDSLGAEDTPLNAAMGAKWLIQAVARIMQPGCQADATLLLIGPQGALKSSSLETMAGADYFTDALTDLGSKDSRQELRGRWIVELSEFVSRRSELERKGFLTARQDFYRAPYERIPQQIPRSCVFAASSNDDAPLGDETGGRRYWPVSVGKIDIEKLKTDRDQLWAEAFVRYCAGEPWYADFSEFQAALTAEQENRYTGGPFDEVILPWLDDPKRRMENDSDRVFPRWDSQKGKVTLNDVLLHACGMAQHSITQRDRLAARACLIHAGWTQEKRVSRVASSNGWARFYVKKGGTI